MKESFLVPCSITSLRISYLLNANQVFLPGDYCISQLLSITHKIYKYLDFKSSVDVRGTFLDTSKAFAKAWHAGLIYKLKSYGVENKTSKPNSELSGKLSQRVLLNGWTSKGTNFLAVVPQDSVLDSLLFLIYINDLHDGLRSVCKVFAGNMLLYSKINDKDTSNIDVNNDLVKMSRWAMPFNEYFFQK